MQDKFFILPFEKFLNSVFTQLNNGKFFGIPQQLFFTASANDAFKMQRFGQTIATPLGVAAGPHTQLTQNILAAWLCGARYIELKTIQTLDELNVSKPCIDMQDEGYNCEWSQELKLNESFHQYLDAWIIIHAIQDMWFKQKPVETIFNISAGYNLEGILNPNVQWFLNKIVNCKEELEIKLNTLKRLFPQFEHLQVPDCISNNITLSTMHGCPPHEIEAIARYFIEQRKMNTIIKLNPTLLGKEEVQLILNDITGYSTVVPDIAFEHDLKYNDAVKMIEALKKSAAEHGVMFGLKLSNTLECINTRNVFAAENEMMYMSGRALHCISINLARRLQNQFHGSLDISFSAGVDCFNVVDVLKCGLTPVTVCSDLLKSGGYGRLAQYVEALQIADKDLKTDNPLEYLNEYADSVLLNSYYQKNTLEDTNIKSERPLESFDCIAAPCSCNCPTNQRIPDYLYLASRGELHKAFEVIFHDNPFPSITGMICDHQCQTKCTRINYDQSLLIRDVKRFVAENVNFDTSDNNLLSAETKAKVAVIGAGVSGLACAYYLKKAGIDVTVYEQKSSAGGMISSVIPDFRLTKQVINRDIKRIEHLGVKIVFNYKVNKQAFNDLMRDYDFIYVAAGAQKAKKLKLADDNTPGIIDALLFLEKVKNNTLSENDMGNTVAVIGGGNTAMDTARAAKRLVNNNGRVMIIYRRTMNEMPADKHEVKQCLDEGIELMELLTPLNAVITNGKITALVCAKMKLDTADNSGRPTPVMIPDAKVTISLDTIITAVGQDLDIDFIQMKLQGETGYDNVLIGGDAMRGAATAIKAIADGKHAAINIAKQLGIKMNRSLVLEKNISFDDLMIKRAKRQKAVEQNEIPVELRNNFSVVNTGLSTEQAIAEASRCLQCDMLCNICVTVCPNLANHCYSVTPIKINYINASVSNGEIYWSKMQTLNITQSYQIINIANWCNECGNCKTFCPTNSAPYMKKPKLHLTNESFLAAKEGFYFNNDTLTAKIDNLIHTLIFNKDTDMYEYSNSMYKVMINQQYKAIDIKIIDNSCTAIDLYNAIFMTVLFKNIQTVF